MFQRKHFIIISVLVYAVLIFALLKYQIKESKEGSVLKCKNKVCVSFCCDGHNCNQKYIDENFNISANFINGVVFWDEIEDRDLKVKATFIKPKCNLKHLKENERWDLYPEVTKKIHLNYFCF